MIRNIISNDIKKYFLDMTCFDKREEEYFKVVSNYITYYHYRAWMCKHAYYLTNFLKIAILTGITILCVVTEDGGKFAAVGSAVSLLLEGINGLFHFSEKWILYRNTDNVLLSEARCYMVSEGIYKDKEKKFPLFVKAVENIIGDEARKWNETVMKKNRNISPDKQTKDNSMEDE